MTYVTVTAENLEKEHICCALADKKGFCGAQKKKEWLREQMSNGLVFRKADVRGKVFIEYLPSECGWQPIKADNYMQINCLWVSGSYKNQGHGKYLLESCIEDAKKQNKYGLVALSSKKKKGFLSDPDFLKKYGFEVCDSAEPYYELFYLPFHEDAPRPAFMENAKRGTIDDKEHVVIYYTNQCPFTEDYVRLVGETAEEYGIPFKAIKYETAEMARQAPVPSTTYSLFQNGNFVTHETLSVDKFLKLMGKK